MGHFRECLGALNGIFSDHLIFRSFKGFFPSTSTNGYFRDFFILHLKPPHVGIFPDHHSPFLQSIFALIVALFVGHLSSFIFYFFTFLKGLFQIIFLTTTARFYSQFCPHFGLFCRPPQLICLSFLIFKN